MLRWSGARRKGTFEPPSSLALHARPEALLARPSKSAQADLEPRPSPPQGGRPPTARQSRFRGGKLDHESPSGQPAIDMSALSNTTPSASHQHKALRFLTAGSVDDGKSTLIGRLLFDSRAILADQLDSLHARAA